MARKTKSTQSSTRRTVRATRPKTESTAPSSSTVATAASKKTDKTFDLRLVCGHWLHVEKRPNPRKVWPDPQKCEVCNKNFRVCEIHRPRVAVSHLTAPTAPKKYRQKLERAAKKKS